MPERTFLLCVTKADHTDYVFCNSKDALIAVARCFVRLSYDLQYAKEITEVEDLYQEVYDASVDAVWEDDEEEEED